ncbi:hypothetical protein [Synechococcus phage BUCT-ZZ01]|nr:hypothetical protein [Synechococcus phage BUCT-ZZ01]
MTQETQSKNLVEQIVDIAMEVDKEYPVDFAMLNLNERDIYMQMASGILEMYLSAPPDQREMILLGAMTQMVVENFVLSNTLIKGNNF